MPELDAEHRDQMAEALRDVLDRCTCTPFPQGEGPEIDCPMHGRADFQGIAAADAVAPLVAGWLAEERERARFNDEVRREQLRMARADALREAADNIHEVSGHSAGVPVWRSQVADWLNERADRGGDDG